MFQLFFLNLWSNIKRSPLVSILIFFQIAILSFCLINVLFDKTQSDYTNNAYQGVYLENSLFDIRSYNVDGEEVARASAGMFESLDKTGLDDYEAFHEIIMSSEDIKTAVMTGTGTNSDYYSVDRDYIDIFGFVLDSGRVFTEEEFEIFDVNRIPVILGYSYKEEYSLGDTFESPHIALGKSSSLNCTYEVIGFIAEGQIFFVPGGGGPYRWDKKIVLPYHEKNLAEWLDIWEENQEYLHKKTVIRHYISGLGANAISGRHYLIEGGKEEILIDYMNNALIETGLVEFYNVGGTLKATVLQTGDELAEKNAIYTSLVLIMIGFSLVSVVFSAINNVSNNMKTYAVHNLVGATQTQIIMYAVIEIFIYSTLGFLTGFLWQILDFVRYNYLGHEALPAALNLFFIIAIVFIVLACVLSFVFVYIKVKSYSTSELIRGREVKKNKKQPIYKVMYLVMIALASISVTFLNSYNYQVDHIDKYQNNYLPKNGSTLYVQRLVEKEDVSFDFCYDIEGIDSYGINVVMETIYNKDMTPKVRGFFYKEGYTLPQITKGRFFSAEEVTKESDYAVVGKNALADFGVERDGKQYITYKDKEYEIIGIVGREGHDTSLDDWLFLTLPTVIDQFGVEGRPMIVDGKTEAEQNAVIEYINSLNSEYYTFLEHKYSSEIDIGISKNIVDIFIVLIIITAIVFCIYFIDKIKHIINVKKFLGYSKKMILLDTAAQFIALSSIGYLVGNFGMYLLSKTIFKDIALFSAFQINLQVLAFSYSMVLLVSFLFSVFAINKAFRGSARDLKRG